MAVLTGGGTTDPVSVLARESVTYAFTGDFNGDAWVQQRTGPAWRSVRRAHPGCSVNVDGPGDFRVWVGKAGTAGPLTVEVESNIEPLWGVPRADGSMAVVATPRGIPAEHVSYGAGTVKDALDSGVGGTAATVDVGSVTQGATASVVNSGTPQAAVFDFTLPKGDPGANGAAGPPGVGTGLDVTAYVEAGDNGDLALALGRAAQVSNVIAIPSGNYTLSAFDYPEGLNLVGPAFNPTVSGPTAVITITGPGLRNPQADAVTPSNSVRRRLRVRGIKFVGPGTGSAITGPFGGLIEECAFSGFDKAIANGAAYLSRYVRCNFAECTTAAISLADANGCRIEDCFMAADCKKAITMLLEVPQSVGTNNGSPLIVSGCNINMGGAYSNNTAVQLRGNVLFEGNYFEDYTPNGTISNNTFIELLVGRFDNMAFTCINNEFNGQGEADHAIRIYGTHSLECACNGVITRNRFLGHRVADVVFGTAADPTLNRISNLRIFDNGGGTTISNWHQRAVYRPMFDMGFDTAVDASGATWVTLPMGQDVRLDNADGATANGYTARKDGLYRVRADVQADVQILVNGVSKKVGHGSVETIVSLANTDDITVQARNAAVSLGSLTGEWKGNGHH